MTTPPRDGDRFVVRSPFTATVMTHWLAPFTGGAEKLIPAGLAFTIDYDPPPVATAIGVKPDEPEQWLNQLVDEADRNDPKFGGYSISILFTQLNAHCEQVA